MNKRKPANRKASKCAIDVESYEKALGVAFNDLDVAKAIQCLPNDLLPDQSTQMRPLLQSLEEYRRRKITLSRSALKLSCESYGLTIAEVCSVSAIFDRCLMKAALSNKDEALGIIHALKQKHSFKTGCKAIDDAVKDFNASKERSDPNAMEKFKDNILNIQSHEELRVWDAEELLSDDIAQHPPLIDGLLREGEIMNLVASPKARKSWLVMELATCLEHGEFWLGNFKCSKASVLLIDNELHLPTLRDRAKAIYGAKGIAATPNIKILPVRGQRFTLHDVPAYLRQFKPQVVILDALYRLFPEGFVENDNAHMTQLYNDLDAMAKEHNVAIIVVHHSSKGNQMMKAVTDVGSGAGAQSRAADAHVTLRPVKGEDQAKETRAYLDAVGRSFAPVGRMEVEWQYPLWKAVDPANYTPEPSINDFDTFVATVYTNEFESAMVLRERAKDAGLVANDKFSEFQHRAISKNLIEKRKDGNKVFYRLFVPEVIDEDKPF